MSGNELHRKRKNRVCELLLKAVSLDRDRIRLDHNVRIYTAAAVNGSAGIGFADRAFRGGRVGILIAKAAALGVIAIKIAVGIIALDQSSRGSFILRDRQKKHR